MSENVITIQARDLRVGDAIVQSFPDTAWDVSWVGRATNAFGVGGCVKIVTGLGVKMYFPSTEVRVIRKES